MSVYDDFAAIIKRNEPLAGYTYLRVGGPADGLAEPRSVEELVRLVQQARQEGIPVRLLGGGSNLLVRDEGVRGLVIRLSEPAFTAIRVEGTTLYAGAGALLSTAISEAAKHGLSGLEPLIGMPGTVGGAVWMRSGSRFGNVWQRLQAAQVLLADGQLARREAGDLRNELAADALVQPILLEVELALEKDNTQNILKRMRKFWIHRQAQQPFSFQTCGRLFKDPRVATADQLIQQAGLKGTRVGGAEISERDANYVIMHPGGTARDVLRLIELARTRVAETTGQTLSVNLVVW
ncbi:MAG: UDP-N-acetylenolpyruvoylglucosamine reductase [Gemmataceae bacterium]